MLVLEHHSLYGATCDGELEILAAGCLQCAVKRKRDLGVNHDRERFVKEAIHWVGWVVQATKSHPSKACQRRQDDPRPHSSGRAGAGAQSTCHTRQSY